MSVPKIKKLISPMARPRTAPIERAGTKTPAGIGKVIEKTVRSTLKMSHPKRLQIKMAPEPQSSVLRFCTKTALIITACDGLMYKAVLMRPG
jgi:hypothetical protein